MRRGVKRASIISAAGLGVLLVLFLPGLPWSAWSHHTFKRTIARAEIRFAKLRGQNPRLASIAGHLDEAGVQIEALDSRSGFAGETDKDGNFALPDVMWYPSAAYELVIAVDDTHGKVIKITAPGQLPDSGEFDAGELDLSRAAAIDLKSLIGLNSISIQDFDSSNRDYYKELFDKLTAGKQSDEEKVEAVSAYIATKLNYEETQWELGSPRRVIERGSQYCGHLSAAMQTVLSTGGYRTRAVHMSDGRRPPGTHVVVEVSYGGAWHLYDPTYDLRFLKKDGSVASYNDVRLDTNLISKDLLTKFPEKVRSELMTLLPGVYGTGYHHFFYFRGEQWGASKTQPSS
jgi:Transglutaminase-like superfamily